MESHRVGVSPGVIGDFNERAQRIQCFASIHMGKCMWDLFFLDLIRPVQVSSPWEDLHQLEILFPNFFTVGSAVINLASTSFRMSQQISQ